MRSPDFVKSYPRIVEIVAHGFFSHITMGHPRDHLSILSERHHESMRTERLAW